MRKIYLILSMFLLPASLLANNITISQIDTSELFLKQKVNLYVNVSDSSGNALKDLTEENIELYESLPKPGKKSVRIDNAEIQVIPHVNQDNGINFYLMIDNSGSMYQGMNGKRTGDESFRRISHAKNAVSSFLDSIDNPNDNVGLASYNTNFESFSEPSANIDRVKNYLQDITRPGPGEGYTEMYGSLSLGVNDFKKISGRKVIILLTDGANQPYYKLTGKLHEVFGKKTYSYKEPIEFCNEEGISVFAIYFGPRGGIKDQHLDEIAKKTGGAVFSAHNKSALANVYQRIRKQILNEYLVTYPASMFAANKKNVKMVLVDGKKRNSTERYYFSGSVLGMPVDHISWLFLLPFLLALALFAFLVRLKFENTNEGAYLELLDKGVSQVSTKMFTLNKASTVIGGSNSADMTIVGDNKDLQTSQATIVYNKLKKNYTLVSKGSTKVNNRDVKTKILEPGDVINVCGTTVVFDNNKI